MIRCQNLFIDATNIRALPKEDLKHISSIAGSTRECLIDGFKAIGNLMFWACEHENYPDNEMRGDMANIGLLLTRGSEIIESIIEIEDITEFHSKKETDKAKP